MERLASAKDEGTLETLLGSRMTFGTAGTFTGAVRFAVISTLTLQCGYKLSFVFPGLRALMGAGYSCMNDLTIIQTTQVCKGGEPAGKSCMAEIHAPMCKGYECYTPVLSQTCEQNGDRVSELRLVVPVFLVCFCRASPSTSWTSSAKPSVEQGVWWLDMMPGTTAPGTASDWLS